MRRGIVGVIGGDQDTADLEAFEVGQAIVRAGMILCTGGRPFPGRAVKDVSMRGAATVAAARVIGFLPKHVRAPDPPHDSHLFVETRLPSTGRNAFTGLTPDAMIVFKGSRGTLTEMAFAWARGTPVWLWDSRGFLREKRQHHAVNRDGSGSVRDQMMDALAILPRSEADTYSLEVLDATLDHALDRAPDASGRPLDVVRRIIERTGLTTQDQTGYPGRRDRLSSKDWFEREVVRISGCSHGK
jgi:hypothetical protein